MTRAMKVILGLLLAWAVLQVAFGAWLLAWSTLTLTYALWRWMCAEVECQRLRAQLRHPAGKDRP